MSLSPRAAFILLCACLLCSAANVSARKSLRQPQDAAPTPAASVDGAELLAGTSPEQAAVEPTVDATASLQPLSVVAEEAVVPLLAAPTVPEPALAVTADLVDATTAGDAAAQTDPAATAAAAAAAATGTNNFDVIVVGAGLAGLKAAVDLAAKNYKVLVLEGRNRVGGRVWSAKPSATATYSLEVGAQWLHGDGRSNDMYTFWTTTMGAASQVISTGGSSNVRTSTSATVLDDTAFFNTYNDFISWGKQQSWSKTPSTSIATAQANYTAFKQLTTYQQQGLSYTISTMIEEEFAASASQLSLFLYDEGLDLLGSDYVLPLTRNLSEAPANLAARLPAGALRLNQNVTLVSHNSTGVTVTVVDLTNGQTWRPTAKAAIMAAPLGVLKQRGSAFFNPTLSTAKQNAISRIGMGLLNKVALEFPTSWATSGPFAGTPPWWFNRLPNATGDSGLWQEFFVLKKAVGSTSTVGPILVAFLAGLPADNAEKTMTDAQTVASVMAQLRKWWPTLPNPTNSLVTRWRADPWAYGAYSYASTSCTGSYRGDPDERYSFQSPNGRIWFAGEHTNTSYPSTMQGAYGSGQYAAAKVLAAGIL